MHPNCSSPCLCRLWVIPPLIRIPSLSLEPAGRFSRNAAVPSFLSSVAQHTAKQCRFQVQRIRKRKFETSVHRLHRILNGQGRIGDDLLAMASARESGRRAR